MSQRPSPRLGGKTIGCVVLVVIAAASATFLRRPLSEESLAPARIGPIHLVSADRLSIPDNQREIASDGTRILGPGTCLHFKAQIPPRAVLSLEASLDGTDAMRPGQFPCPALFAKEIQGETYTLAVQCSVEGASVVCTADLSSLEHRLADFYLGPTRQTAEVAPTRMKIRNLQILAPETNRGQDLNILLVVIDTLRADHLGCYGNDRVRTPTLDRLASQGVRFAGAFTHIPITGPSHTTLFTSRYASEAGVLNNGKALPEQELCLAEVLGYTGRKTYGFASMEVLQKSFHFNQGFDVFRDDIPPPWQLDAEQINNRIQETLLNQPEEPFFAFVHYCDPHEPYMPHADEPCVVEIRMNTQTLGSLDLSRQISKTLKVTLQPGANVLRFVGEKAFRMRGMVAKPRPAGLRQVPGGGWQREGRGILSSREGEMVLHLPGDKPAPVEVCVVLSEVLSNDLTRRNYAREVEHVDQQLGVFLDAMRERGLLEKTLVIVTADHGESLGEHDLVGHIEQLYDPLLHIPLIFRFPKMEDRGKVVDGLVAITDVMPTLLDFLEIQIPVECRGVSLLEAMASDKPLPPRSILLETFAPEAIEDKQGIRTAFRKYIRSPKSGREEVYNLREDPAEKEDISGKEPLTTEQLRELLTNQTAAPLQPASQSEELLDETALEALKALGYFR